MARKLSNETMVRIAACAEIAKVDKAEKITAIAATMEGDVDGAAKRYVLGALKAGIRRGAYRTYDDALDAFERAQVGDRGDSLSVPNDIERTVRHINYVNAQPTTEWERSMTCNKAVEVRKSHARNMAKVMGRLYVQWQDDEERYTVEYMVDADARDARVMRAENHIKAYIAEYIGRLSPTASKAIHEIVASAYGVDDIMGASRAPEADKLRNKVNYLYRGFPAKDALSSREFLEIVRKYAA